MKVKDIIRHIEERTDIKRLNAMQTEMSTTSANRLLLIAPTGSGKTIAFALRLLRAIDYSRVGQGLQAAVIAPSRELVLQIAEVLRRVAVGLKVTPLYGGHSMDDETNSLSVTPDIIVATPGRLLDHINRRSLYFDGVQAVVLDEYDKSLELGFADEMGRIMRRLRSPRLLMLTSATILPSLPAFIGDNADFAIMDFSDRAGAPVVPVPVVEVPSPVRDKLDTLTALLLSMPQGKTIIFVNHRESAERVYDRLHRDGFPAVLYHGQLDQSRRRHALQLLANGSAPILVATDLASRGLDIPQVDSVIHYHLPLQQSVWTHRNGRTARQGAPGTVYAIVSDGDSLPQFIGFDRSYSPKAVAANPIAATSATLHINAGRKEKISRGDILGYLVKVGGLEAAQVGNISLDDHESTVAVPLSGVDTLLVRLAPEKLKGRRVRVTLLQ